MRKVIFIIGLVVSSVMPFLASAEEVMRMPVERKSVNYSVYPVYSIMEAVYNSSVKDRIIYTEAKYKISIGQDDIINVPILSEELAIVKTNLPKGVLLTVNNGRYQLMFSKKGEYNVDIDFTSQLKKIENSNIFSFQPSVAVMSKLNLSIPETNLDIEVTPSLSVQTKEIQGKETQLVVFLGTTTKLGVKWISKPQTTNVQPIFLSENKTLVIVSDEVVGITSILNYEIRQGKISSLKINLPLNSNLIAVKGRSIKNWDLKQVENTQILEVELSEEITDNYELTLEMEQNREQETPAYILPQITTLGSERESGYVGIIAKENLKIQAVEKTGFSQIDVNEFPEVLRNKEREISLAYRYLRQPVTLSLNIQKISPEITVRNNIFLHTEEDLLKLQAVIDYDIRKAGVFGFNVELPKDFTLIDVEGKGIEDWAVSEQESCQLLTVRLNSKAFGQYQLLVKMEKPGLNVLEGIDVPVIKVCNTTREIGYIGISSAANIKLGTGKKNNIAEVDISELIVPDRGTLGQYVLAYKYTGQPYELKLTAQEVEPRVIAEVFTFTSVGEGFLLMDSAITYNILYAGVDEFTVVFPQDVKVFDITGKNIRSKEEIIEEREADGKKIKEKIVKVHLQSKVKGEYNLYCSYERNLESDTAAIELPKLQVLNVARESGSYCLGARTSGEIKAKTVSGVVPIDVTELPQDKAAGIDIPLVLAFKYARHPYNISIDLEKHEDVSVLVAMAESAKITTMLTKEGEVIVNALYNIKNKQKQYLNIYLPADVNIWSVFVNSKPVRPSRTKDGSIVIPLEKSLREGILFPVEIIYETNQSKFAFWGRLGLSLPRLDIPVSNVTAKVYLPQEFIYVGLGGNMEIVKRGRNNLIMGHYDPKGNLYPGNESLSPIEINKNKKDELSETANRQVAQKEDEDFRSNIISQQLRYQKYMEQQDKQQGVEVNVPYKRSEVSHGKLTGALPIHVTIPTGGKLFTFNKLLSTNESLVVRAVYVTGAVFKIFCIAALGSLVVLGIIVLRAKKSSCSESLK